MITWITIFFSFHPLAKAYKMNDLVERCCDTFHRVICIKKPFILDTPHCNNVVTAKSKKQERINHAL